MRAGCPIPCHPWRAYREEENMECPRCKSHNVQYVLVLDRRLRWPHVLRWLAGWTEVRHENVCRACGCSWEVQ